MAQYFFTGFPGFIASALIKHLFIKEYPVKKVYVLVLPQLVTKAEKEIEKLANSIKIDKNRFTIVSGDITKPGIAIEAQLNSEIQENVTHVFHLAAIYDLAVPYDLAYKVNVTGTKYVNDWLMTLKKLERYVYFSTAYVSGTREGRIYENELDMGQTFKNHYESTKFEAEKLVDELKARIPLTIIRPGIVKGDSKSGETIKFDGPYFLLNLLDKLRFLPFIPYMGKSHAEGNFVPIDYILNATIYLAHADVAIGKTYHLTDPKPYRMREIYQMVMEEYLHKKPRGTMPLMAAKGFLSMAIMRRWLRLEKESLDYLTCKAEYDCSMAQKDLEKAGIICPDFKEVLRPMVAFYDAHKNDKEKQLNIQ